MRANSAVKFSAIVVLIALLAYVALNGFNLLYGVNIPKARDAIRLGLDLKGGVYIVYTADTDKPVTTAEMESARSIITSRLDAKNYEANVTTDVANKRLIVEIPAVEDGEKAVQEIGAVAHLTFREADEQGNPTPDGPIVLEGKDIKTATYQFGPTSHGGNPESYVSLEMTSEGAVKFAEATARLIGQKICIYLDRELQSAPTVSEAIPNGMAVINGDFNEQTAGYLAAVIRSGSLPFGLKAIQIEEIGPILGQRVFDISVQAGFVALILIMIFMLLFYRLPGIIADIALIAYTVLTVLAMALMKFTLTLPGIAGIILSIGMAVDANVVIFERIKEEMKSGKTLRAAIEAGFTRAFTAVFDGNMTTVIAGLILLWLGTGTIQGFAKTLIIGIIISMFTAITLTKFLLRQFVDFNPNLSKHSWLYGAAFKGGKTQ